MMSPDTQAKQFRILIADDDPAGAIRLEGMLRDAGHREVRATTDLNEVLNIHAKWAFDLLLIDLAGSEVGYRVMAELAAEAQKGFDTPIALALLEDSRRETQERALVAGARDFIVRPFDWPEVISRVRNMIDLKGARETAAS